MAVVVTELFEGSRELTTGTNATYRLAYDVEGTSDELEAAVAVQNTSPAIQWDLVRQSIAVEPVTSDRWKATVTYGVYPRKETGESSISFDTTGGTQHITQARANIANYAPAGITAPTFSGAIGVGEEVEGVDITVPVFNYQETHYLPGVTLTQAYRMQIFALTGCMNNAAFKGFAAGECLFLGASGSQRGSEDWEVTFKFAGSPNMANFTIGNITVTAKYGWDYLWVRYQDEEDGAAKKLVKRPASVHVERVYNTGNFALLGIGT